MAQPLKHPQSESAPHAGVNIYRIYARPICIYAVCARLRCNEFALVYRDHPRSRAPCAEKNIYSPADDACRQLRRVLGAKVFYTYLPLREKRLFFHQKLHVEELHRMELDEISCISPPFGWHRCGQILRRISAGNNKVTNLDLSPKGLVKYVTTEALERQKTFAPRQYYMIQQNSYTIAGIPQ